MRVCLVYQSSRYMGKGALIRMSHYIRVENLSKKIGSKVVLQDINFELEGGKIYGFIGENGSGKTMLFRTMSGLIKPSSGTVWLDESNVHKSCEKKVGIILENGTMWPELTGYENLLYLSRLNNYISKQEIVASLERVGLDPKNLLPIRKYSLGMRQRLMLAQAIMEKPNYIFLDEPTNAIDKKGVQLVYNIIREEAERGAVVCVSSHVDEDISNLCEEVYWMEKGICKKVVNENEKTSISDR